MHAPLYPDLRRVEDEPQQVAVGLCRPELEDLASSCRVWGLVRFGVRV